MAEFTDNSMRRIGRAVLKSERMRAPAPGRPRPKSPLDRGGFLAELTGINSEGDLYSWKQVAPDPDTPGTNDITPAVTGTENAFEINGGGAAIGDTVRLKFAGYTESGDPRYQFASPAAARQFYVIEVHNDYLICHLIKRSGEVDTTDITVAKYPEVQKSEYDGASVTDPIDGTTVWSFSFSGTQTRVVTKTGGGETQVIVPRYVPAGGAWPGSRITAAPCKNSIKDDGGGSITARWIELTNRAWAKKKG